MSSLVEPEAKYDLVSPQFFADPHAVFRRMRAEDPVYWHPTMKMWFLTRYADIQRIARDPRFTATRADHFGQGAPSSVQPQLDVLNRFFSKYLIFNDAPMHTRLRGLINKAFTSNAIETLRSFIRQVVNQQVDAVRSRGEMEIVEQFALPLPAGVIARMLGIPATDIPLFKGWADDLFALFGSQAVTAELVERGHRGVVGFTSYLRGVIEERRRRPSDDLLSLIVHAEEQGQVLDEEEIVATATLLLVAGYETTTNLICNGLIALFEHPDQLHQLRDHPELVTGAVEEFLRYNGAGFQLVRRGRDHRGPRWLPAGDDRKRGDLR